MGSSTHLVSDMELDSTEVPCCGTSSVVTLSSQKEHCKNNFSGTRKVSCHDCLNLESGTNQFHCVLLAKNHRPGGLVKGRGALYQRRNIKVATTLLTCHAHQAFRPSCSGATYTRGSLCPPPQAGSSFPFCSCKPSAPLILSLLSRRFLYVSYSFLPLEN